MGSCVLAWPDADLAIARAAASRGIPYVLSTMSTTSMEELARSVDGPLWFQLYVFKNYQFNRDLLRRAEASGYSTLVVTVDLQTGGKREKDMRNGMSIPLKPSLHHLIEGMMRPGWSFRFLRGRTPEFANIRGYAGDNNAGLTIAARAARDPDDGFTFEKFRRLRDWWKGKMIVKGVLHAQDAADFVAAGADGIWVSNHGGRQLDSAISSIKALPMIRAAVGERVPVLVDSGVRRGMDAIKSRALGANAVGIGRAAVFGVSAGQAGVSRVLDILIDEIENGMKLSGSTNYVDIDSHLLSPDCG